MTKRIVIEYLTGIRKIIGFLDVADNVEYANRIDHIEGIGPVVFIPHPKFILYKEIANGS